MRSVANILCVATLGLTPAVAVASVEPVVIVIDAGHGGSDCGATGVTGTHEKALTLAVSNALRDALLQSLPGVEVVMTRADDVYPTLEERSGLANALEADLFISLHFNSAPNPAAEGIETFFLDPTGTVPGDVVPGRETDGPAIVDTEIGVGGDVLGVVLTDLARDGAQRRAARLAETVQDALIDATGATDRGVRQGQFRVLRGARAPAIVVELGFLTHPDEAPRLETAEYQAHLVDGLSQAVAAYVDWDTQMQARIERPESDALDAQASLR